MFRKLNLKKIRLQNFLYREVINRMLRKQMTASEMGKKGGKISKRVLTSEQAREMVKAREAKKKKARK